jgi:hypothetical protein
MVFLNIINKLLNKIRGPHHPKPEIELLPEYLRDCAHGQTKDLGHLAATYQTKLTRMRSDQLSRFDHKNCFCNNSTTKTFYLIDFCCFFKIFC